MGSIHDLHIAVIGSGMGGLASALALGKRGFKNVHVYEIAPDLGFVGAGIQLATNLARVLDNLGVWKEIEAESVDLRGTSIRQGSTDQELAYVDLNYIREQYDFPHMVGHRASLAGGLYNGAKAQPGVHFHLGSIVQEVKSFGPKAKFVVQPTAGGDSYEVETDVLLACDGVKSNIRAQMLKELDITASVVDTGQAAYRILLTRDEMKKDPDLSKLIDAECVTRWIGEKRHIIAYPISNKTIYNISTIQPDTNFAEAPSITYTTKGSKTEMLKVFGDFCPMIHRMLDLVPEGEVVEWKLRVHSPLPTWVHGTTALVGDACHPTLPHLAQGAAQAIEDAAVLGVVLSKMPDASTETVNKTLRVYEQLRRERTETLVELAAASGRALHLGEGKAKEERDKAFAELKNGSKTGGKVPDKWADAEVQKMIYGHDCMKVAEDEYDRLFKEIDAPKANGSNGHSASL
ncbi:salicylate hydroxylase-like protein [Phyllosticta citribraziliensis]|uniref:Salicylate hydroxylase-like protein n=1 Tax=Phyllosticta citribraziliensis TaxID=989973 RepID=A0ABR1L8D1_9PEZI